MNLVPAFKYRLFDSAKGAGVFLGVMTIVMSVLMCLFTLVLRDGSTSFSAMTMAGSIFCFVLGIVVIRDDLRLCIQNGISRRTAFTASALVAILVSVLVSACGELLTALFQFLARSHENIYFNDLYQLLYMQGNTRTMPLSEHIRAFVFMASSGVALSFVGMFCSLVFFRLSKTWAVIVAVGAPLLLFAGIPLLLELPGVYAAVAPLFIRFGTWVAQTPWNYVLMVCIVALLFALFDFLLTRRAPVRPAAK